MRGWRRFTRIAETLSNRKPMKRDDKLLIWDLPVRLFHWSIVFCVAGSWATHYAGLQWFGWHRRFGYAVLVLVTFRVIWGFVGTYHARFTSFLKGPREIIAYLRRSTRAETSGHNPLGALSVLALLVALLFQACTGLFANDEIASTGPFYGWVSHQLSNRLTSWHHANSEFLLVLIGVHLVAVLWYTIVQRQPLVRAMITGCKQGARAAGEPPVRDSRAGVAALILLALAIALALTIRAAPQSSLVLF
jgi:cytochrome b